MKKIWRKCVKLPRHPSEIDREMICNIQQLVGHLIAKSEQLLVIVYTYTYIYMCMRMLYYAFFAGNFTTNLAELWMHIRSKFDGGKQIDLSQSGSWQQRCAGLCQVLGPVWGPWKNTSDEANSVCKSISMAKENQVSQDRKERQQKQRRRGENR